MNGSTTPSVIQVHSKWIRFEEGEYRLVLSVSPDDIDIVRHVAGRPGNTLKLLVALEDEDALTAHPNGLT
jgi:hypothetical protein